MNYSKYVIRFSYIAGLILTSNLFLVMPATAANCEKNPNHDQCPGNADPQIVYRDGGIFLANPDGKSPTEIRSGGVEPRLDAGGMRVLFYDYPSLGNLDYLGLIRYRIDAGNIELVSEDLLLSTADISTPTISGKFTSRGLIDWSPGGDRFAYNIRQDYGDGLGWRSKVMVAPDVVLAPDGTSSTNFAEHIEVWNGAPDGGFGFGAWDASGDYYYFLEDFNDPGGDQWLLVLDARSAAGTTNPPQNEIIRINLTNMIGNNGFGFAADSNAQAISASFVTGGSDGGYSFDPLNLLDVPRISNTSLCLMLPLIDWSTRKDTRFTMIFDLPVLFDPMSELSCPLTAAPTATIEEFQGADFTTVDTGMVGTDYGNKGRYGGISIYNFGDQSRTKIIVEGGGADWSN
jgi:hypothetical protein